MQALILAAGETLSILGFPKGSKPKCLFHKNGEVILERQIPFLRELGIKKINIVVGYQKEKIAKFCNDKKLKVNLIYNPNWQNEAWDSLRIPFEKIKDDLVILFGDFFVPNKETIEQVLKSTRPVALYARNRLEPYILKLRKDFLSKVDLNPYWTREKARRKREEKRIKGFSWDASGFKIAAYLTHWAQEIGAECFRTRNKEDIDHLRETDEGEKHEK